MFPSYFSDRNLLNDSGEYPSILLGQRAQPQYGGLIKTPNPSKFIEISGSANAKDSERLRTIFH
jgi:hypothetical protein